MILFSVGCILVVISVILLFMSYRMYSYRGLLQDGYVFVRVLYLDKKQYGWVRRNSIMNLDRIDHDRYQWFIELYGPSKIVIKIEKIKEISKVTNPFLICFRGSVGKVNVERT